MSAMPSSPAKFAGGSDAWLGDGNATRDTMMLVFEIPHLSTEPFVPPSGETILRIEPDVYRKLCSCPTSLRSKFRRGFDDEVLCFDEASPIGFRVSERELDLHQAIPEEMQLEVASHPQMRKVTDSCDIVNQVADGYDVALLGLA